MTNEEILREIASLPIEAQRQIEDYVTFLREKYKTSSTDKPESLPDLKSEPFIGMWKDREDMQDSTAWVRSVRERHWGK